MATRYASNSATNGFGAGVASGAGDTPATAWTLEYALSTLADGDDLIVNDGTYTHATYWQWTSARSGSIRPLTARGVTLRATGAQTKVFNIDAGNGYTKTIGAFVIDGQTVCTTAAGCAGANTGRYIFDGTWLKDCVEDGYYQYLTNNKLEFLNVKVTGAMTYSGIRVANHTTAGASVKVDGYEFDLTGTTQANGGALYAQANAAGATLFARGFSGNVASNAANAVIHIRGGYQTVIEGDKNKKITRSGSGAGALVWINPYNYIKAHNPIIRGIVGENNTSGTAGYLIIVGSDGPSADQSNCADDPIITDCDVRAAANVTSCHGIVVGWQKPGSVTRNRVRGTRYSLLPKGCGTTLVRQCTATGAALVCTGTAGSTFAALKIGAVVMGTGVAAGTTVLDINSATSLTLSQAATSSNVTLEFSDPDASAALWYDNDLEEGQPNGANGGHTYNKGSSNVVFALNRIKITAASAANAFLVAKDDAGLLATKTTHIANTIYASGVAATVIATVGSGTDASPGTFYWNNYRLDGGVSGTPWAYQGTTYATSVLWGAAREMTYRDAIPTDSDQTFWRTAYKDALPAMKRAGFALLNSAV